MKEALLKGVWKPGSNGSSPGSKSKGKPMHQNNFFFLLGWVDDATPNFFLGDVDDLSSTSPVVSDLWITK